VGDERPLDAVEVVDRHHALVVAVVLAQQAQIELGQRRAGEGLAGLDSAVGLELELGEHGLAEHGLAEALEEVAEHRHPEGGVAVRGEQCPEQRLVEVTRLGAMIE
jgi:hypothetical protein